MLTFEAGLKTFMKLLLEALCMNQAPWGDIIQDFHMWLQRSSGCPGSSPGHTYLLTEPLAPSSTPRTVEQAGNPDIPCSPWAVAETFPSRTSLFIA